MATKPEKNWNYRVVKTKNQFGYDYSIRDVYYKNRKPYSWGAEPQFPVGESYVDLLQDYIRFAGAFDNPILELKNKKLIEVKK